MIIMPSSLSSFFLRQPKKTGLNQFPSKEFVFAAGANRYAHFTLNAPMLGSLFLIGI